MTKIIDLPTTASTDANTFVPVYKNGKTQKVSATALGGGGSGLDLTSTADVATVDGTEYVPLNKPLGTVFRVTVQRILDWILARANTWTANQTFNANINFTGVARRITGDFSNPTLANRLSFQTSTLNSVTSVGAIPSGTSNNANFSVYSNSGATDAARGQLSITASGVAITSDSVGSGGILPLVFKVGSGATERLRIDPTTGNVLATSGALGYGIGAGGTVVQATSKSTAVTLNKACGQITMHNESLASGVSVEFSLVNSFLSAADGLVVNPTGFSGYSVEVAYFNGPTEVVLRVTNKGTTRSDPVVIVFRIFKGATS